MKIRKGIFETNSSSSHSFSMGPEGRFGATLDIDENGIIYVPSDFNEGGEQKTNGAKLKLSFLLSFAWTTLTKGYWEKCRELIYSVVKDFTGAIDIDFHPRVKVDHQSTEIIDSRDLFNPEFIKEFVFNEDTWLYLLWDSECPESSFFEDREAKTTLYRLIFNLPGLDKQLTTLEISYRGVSDINYEIYYFLSGFAYSPKQNKFSIKNTDKDQWLYVDEFKYVDPNSKNSVYPIDLPKIEIVPCT